MIFDTDSLSLICANVQAEKEWWIATFGCKERKVPKDWDDCLPSDVALSLPGWDDPTILLRDRTEGQNAGSDWENDHPLVQCSNLNKAHEYLRVRNASPGPIQDGGGGARFFEVRDPEGNVIEICNVP